jgi:hypothetical protein
VKATAEIEEILLTTVEKFGCLQPLEKMLKLRIIPQIFHSILAFFHIKTIWKNELFVY